MKPTAKTELLRVLPMSCDPEWKAVHELPSIGYSENCLSTRLPELAKAGLVASRFRPGKAFKEWSRCVELALVGGSDLT